MRTPLVPDGAEIVRSYKEYRQFVDAFCQGHHQLLFILGRPGLGKSFEFQKRIDGSLHFVKGWTAPLQAYMEAYHRRNQLLVFDGRLFS
jgi:hypothetical protein